MDAEVDNDEKQGGDNGADGQNSQGGGDASGVQGDTSSSGVGASKSAEKNADDVAADMTTPWECDFTILGEEEEDDLLQRATVIGKDTATWIRSEEAESYRSQVDLFFFDPPWGVLFGTDGLRPDDQLFQSDIGIICDFIGKAIKDTGTVLIRTDIQNYHLWYDKLNEAHFTVEKVPLVVCKAPSNCAQVQTRWVGRTSSAFHYVVAHKNARNYTWNRTASGFLPGNIYAPNSNVITGIKPPGKKQRLKNANNEVLRPQVSAVTHSSFVPHCDICSDMTGNGPQ